VKRFGGLVAVDHVSFTVPGAGKTTLIRAEGVIAEALMPDAAAASLCHTSQSIMTGTWLVRRIDVATHVFGVQWIVSEESVPFGFHARL
jgi:ABC-type Na+ transport system ATPase subunit NatA